jgi:serine/threonine protein kinase
MNFIDDYEVIKHIGKGSFSNVYLCKYEDPLCSFKEELFIIKEININELVKSYILRNVSQEKENRTIRRVGKRDKKDIGITPYGDDEMVNMEQEYYYNRLEELIESEIKILSILDHPNIIKFYGYTKHDGIYYLRMEYCDGGDVYDFLKSENLNEYRNQCGGFTNSFMYEFFKQTVCGLDYIHQKNIIHRDIKLHNVLIKYDESGIQFKLSDFGFACYDLSSINKKDIDIKDILYKKYYKLCGTPYYMAPEIILNINDMENIANYKKNIKRGNFIYDKKIDVWSLAICLYELMFNLLPFSNIRTIVDLENFYKLDNIQKVIDKKIKRRCVLTSVFSETLYKMLRIMNTDRCNIKDIKEFIRIHDLDNLIINTVEKDSSDMLCFKDIPDIINCRENVYIKNEQMKQHIIKSPVIDMDLSWEKIKKSSSLILKRDIRWRFLDWFL